MDNMIVRVFDVFANAEQARDALLAAGFTRSSVELSARDDEAGPTQGNFTVGDHTPGRDGPVYERNYTDTTWGGHCVLTVATTDPALAARAAAIMERYGAIEPG